MNLIEHGILSYKLLSGNNEINKLIRKYPPKDTINT